MRSFLMGLRDLWDVVFVFHPPEWPEVRALRAGGASEEFGVTPMPSLPVASPPMPTAREATYRPPPAPSRIVDARR